MNPRAPVTSTELEGISIIQQESRLLLSFQLLSHQTNQHWSSRARYSPHATLILLCDLAPTSSVAIQTNNLRRLLHTVEALSELGPALTAEPQFSETSRPMLSAALKAAGARERALLLFRYQPVLR